MLPNTGTGLAVPRVNIVAWDFFESNVFQIGQPNQK
jgi:hypothetical protein